MSKHLLIGAAAVVISLISLVTGLGSSVGNIAESTTDSTKTTLGAHVVTAARALQPVVASAVGDPTTNPFTMKRAELRSTRLSFPPPPPLDLPALPVLPIAER